MKKQVGRTNMTHPCLKNLAQKKKGRNEFESVAPLQERLMNTESLLLWRFISHVEFLHVGVHRTKAYFEAAFIYIFFIFDG